MAEFRGCQQRNLAAGLYNGSASADELNDEHHERQHKQNMDVPGNNVKPDQANEPGDEQDHE
jgi:hypothetical protein